MAGQDELQELLRMLTARKVPVMKAMAGVKALQDKSLRSIEEIAEAPLATVESALGDGKLAKSFHMACRSYGKKTAKRGAEASTSPEAKRPKLEPHKRDLDYDSMTADELEGSLSLPLVEDEEAMRATTIVTNRAPLVLAFAVELLRFTMPEQPLSSRLSLAQAVVSANSRAKAVSLGIEKAGAGGGEQMPEGQPRVRVLGRDVPVLKRSGYTWASETAVSGDVEAGRASKLRASPGQRTWVASQRLTSKASTFIAHAATLSTPSQRASLVKGLMAEKPELETATHNAWAVRTGYGSSPLVQEASFDDGETGCGKLMLDMMRELDVKNTVVVLTRWFGGVMLGPDRWRLMRACVNDALSSRLRTSTLSNEAVWALDAQAAAGMAIHRPEGARNYLLRSFASAGGGGGGAAAAAASAERQENLGRLLGALRLLFASWAGVLSSDELDRRAWSWYVAVRPDVAAGPAGWGAKGTLSLAKIVDLGRRERGREKAADGEQQDAGL